MSDGQWYYCLTHHVVEPYAGCKALDRLGPYDTYDQASEALERVKQRNAAWDAADDEDGDGEPDSEPSWSPLP